MRKIFDFHGGIHPRENKHQSLQSPIASAAIPPELVVPLTQHIGAAAVPVVTIGERVLKGQMIAEPAGFVSVPAHAPTSGTVVAIEDRLIPHPSGLSARCIVIASDGADTWIEHNGTADYHSLEKTDIMARIRDAGIAGMGGAGFPTAVKLSLKPDTRIDTLIINGTECEPYITADDILMRERAGAVIAGTKIIAHLVSPHEILIGIEDNKPEALAAMRAAAADAAAAGAAAADPDIEILEFPTKYPSGGEKQLIEILTGKQVPSGGLPLDVGIICQNVGTAVAVQDAVLHGRPLISRVTTVTGENIRHPQNFEVLLGTPVRYLLDKAGFEPGKNQRLVMGGPMMGFTLPDIDVPVIKTTNCLMAPAERELPAPSPAQPCIRCGMCAEACPASLLPQQLFWFAQGKEFEKLEQHQLFDCIECGACSWVCPSNIPLVQYYRASKAEILQLRKDHEMAEHARIRFEARQERLAREAAEKEAKRAARKKVAQQRAQAAAAEGGAEDPIQAAIDRAKAKKAAQQAGSDSPVDERQKLEKTVSATRKRLATATAKLDEAGAENSDLVAALQTGLDKTRAKLEAAERALQAFDEADSPQSSPDLPQDAAEAAIEKAKAARAAEAAMSPEQKAREQLHKLRQRLQKTQDRLVESREHGEEEKIVEALESSVSRLEEKVSAAEQQLNELESA